MNRATIARLRARAVDYHRQAAELEGRAMQPGYPERWRVTFLRKAKDLTHKAKRLQGQARYMQTVSGRNERQSQGSVSSGDNQV